MADVRKLLRPRSAAGIRQCLSALSLALIAPWLTGCPLSDDYYIDDSSTGNSTAAGGHTASTSADSGTGGGTSTRGAVGTTGAATETASSGGASSTADTDTANSGGGGEGVVGNSTTGPGSTVCEPACSAGRTCDEGACAGGWVAMAKPPPKFVARRRAAAVAFEGKVFVFGGVNANDDPLDTGAIYDPRTDKWSPVANDPASPSPRELASAVWTGTHILVVGGLERNQYLRDAALYDPKSNRWTSIESAPTPRARGIAGSVDGVVVLLQGITSNGNTEVAAERYDLDKKRWSVAGDGGDSSGHWSSAIAFGKDGVFVYGGNSHAGRTAAAYLYDVGRDAWTELPNALSNRSGSFGVWDGAKFYVFGGHDALAYNDGAVYAAGAWDPIDDDGAPSPRRAPPSLSGWAFALGPGDFAVMGGVDAAGEPLFDGGRYRDDAGWVAIEGWPSGEFHSEGVGVWTGEEFVVWSGQPDEGDDPTLTGERWAP